MTPGDMIGKTVEVRARPLENGLAYAEEGEGLQGRVLEEDIDPGAHMRNVFGGAHFFVAEREMAKGR